MTQISIDDEMKFSVRFAKDVMKRNGTFVTMGIGIMPNGERTIIHMPFENREHKYLVAKAVCDMAKKHNIVCWVFMSEVYFKTMHETELAKTDFSNGVESVPGRLEAIVISVKTADDQKTTLIPFTKTNGGQIDLGIERTMPNGGDDRLFGNMFEKSWFWRGYSKQ